MSWSAFLRDLTGTCSKSKFGILPETSGGLKCLRCLTPEQPPHELPSRRMIVQTFKLAGPCKNPMWVLWVRHYSIAHTKNSPLLISSSLRVPGPFGARPGRLRPRLPGHVPLQARSFGGFSYSRTPKGPQTHQGSQ